MNIRKYFFRAGNLSVLELIFLLFLASSPSFASAQFRETSDGVFQDDSGQQKVVVSYKDGSEGIFVVTGAPIPLQQFNLETTPKSGTNHLFVRFDSTTNTYSELVIGSHHYKITGNLSIKMGGLAEVGIDNSNPYISVTTDGTSKNAIIGFIGLNQVVDGGASEAAVLAANQLDSELAGIIHPYSTSPDGLLLDGKPLGVKTIGVRSTKERLANPCVKVDAMLFSTKELDYVRGGKNETERVQRFDETIKKHKSQERLLFLRVTKNVAYALNPFDQSIKIVQAIKGSGTSSKQVCVAEDFK